MEHFKNQSRGFSIEGSAPLDMRFDRSSSSRSAKDLLNTASGDELSLLFQEYADFSPKKSDEIARKILHTRRSKILETTQDLKALLARCQLGYKASIVIFQAVRIATNDEITRLRQALETLP